MMTPVEQWNGLAAQALRDDADAIEQGAPPSLVGEASIAFASLADDAATAATIERVTRGIDCDRAIYIIMLDAAADPARFRTAFEQARVDRKADLRLPQPNKAGGDSRLVYVGSSCASGNRKRTAATRLHQHLVKAPNGTYALNLSQWATEVPGGISVKVSSTIPPKPLARSWWRSRTAFRATSIPSAVVAAFSADRFGATCRPSPITASEHAAPASRP